MLPYFATLFVQDPFLHRGAALGRDAVRRRVRTRVSQATQNVEMTLVAELVPWRTDPETPQVFYCYLYQPLSALGPARSR